MNRVWNKGLISKASEGTNKTPWKILLPNIPNQVLFPIYSWSNGEVKVDCFLFKKCFVRINKLLIRNPVHIFYQDYSSLFLRGGSPAKFDIFFKMRREPRPPHPSCLDEFWSLLTHKYLVQKEITMYNVGNIKIWSFNKKNTAI